MFASHRIVLAPLLALWLAACGGEPAAPAVVPTPPEPLPVLAALRITAPGDTLRASESAQAALVARDTKSRDMTVGFVAWRSSDPSVLTVSTEGVVLALRAGTATLSAAVGEVLGTRTITVLPPPGGPLPVASVDVTPYITDLDVGGVLQLVAIPRDYAGRPLADRVIGFASNDSAVALVGADGSVTARAPGTALIDVRSEGQRASAYLRVRTPVDTSVIVKVAVPFESTVVGDEVSISATVRSLRPLDGVTATIGGRTAPMTRQDVVGISGVVQYIWVLKVDVSTLPFGPLALVVTGTDVSGVRGVAVVSLVRNPKVSGGGASPPANK